MSIPKVLVELVRRGETLATAESLTGGSLASRITDVAGASEAYLGGVVSYATPVKLGVLGVPEQVVAEHGVVSAGCARAMALGCRDLLGADWALATTGVAGPTELEGKPVGTVFVGLVGPEADLVRPLRLTGDRDTIRTATVDAAVAWLLDLLTG